MIALTQIEIRINGYLIRTTEYDGNINVDNGTLQEHLEKTTEKLFDVFHKEDFGRMEGKRPERCPMCKIDNSLQDAGKKELPPYRDWECKHCSMNGHDGRFKLKDI